MDQTTRNTLRNTVTQCRRLLEEATTQALQGRFGIFAVGRKGEIQVEDEARMTHLSEEDHACRRDLIDHLAHIASLGYKRSEALEQLIREIAFTHLNRLCAYKMMEARGLIREAVSRGLKSQGFYFYLADHPDIEKLHATGQQEAAYRHFLDWLGGTLSQEIGVLFNPNDPANRVYPPQRILDDVLALINDESLRGIWEQDETIGWVYQYFTPKELRDKARKESQAPRNSYELAFRNQFFTPRYVVEFLTDNTLGRIWYEMRQGKTKLADRCRYLVRRPNEVFLAKGQQPPAAAEPEKELSQEELLRQPVHIPFRAKKDPRELRILDPACGSGHFLLYCFDLLLVIYEEAYDAPELGAALRKDYPSLEDLRKAIPGLILRHNLHGIDIDLRATQIAALALWLRCQRAYQAMNLKNGQRPPITRSNIVCAEPMPGDTEMLREFTAELQPKVLGQLGEEGLDKMKLAGEAGSLLKIEEDISAAAAKAKDEYLRWKKQQDASAGFLLKEYAPRAEPDLLDFADLGDERFLDRAEEEIVLELRRYVDHAGRGGSYRRRLFAEDAGRGFAFIDVCRKRYDAVLMNPPFGLAPSGAFEYARTEYPDSYTELLATFVERGRLLSCSRVGAITSRAFMVATRLANWRKDTVINQICLLGDLGDNVMDGAFVEASAYVLDIRPQRSFVALDLRRSPNTERDLRAACFLEENATTFLVDPSIFREFPKNRIAYSVDSRLAALLRSPCRFEPAAGTARQGLATWDDFRFVRVFWELCPSEIGAIRRWEYLAKGGAFSRYMTNIHLVMHWNGDGRESRAINMAKNGTDAQAKQASSYWRKAGLTYSIRSQRGFSARVLPAGCLFTGQGPLILSESTTSHEYILGWLNSVLIRTLIEVQSNDGKFMSGLIKSIPWRTPQPCGQAALETRTREVCALHIRLASASKMLSPYYVAPHLGDSISSSCQGMVTEEDRVRSATCKLDQLWDSYVLGVYGIPRHLVERVRDQISFADADSDEDSDEDSSELDVGAYCRNILDYLVGVACGRWDVRFVTGQRPPLNDIDPFAPLPACPPGVLQGPNGLPIRTEDVPSDYPIQIDWDGILADDAEHGDDIVRRIRDVLSVIWKGRADAIEREACEILGVRELRDYFRKPGNGGFWMDHVKRYSKSRRKAPIYWYLRSAKGNYGLWLYYHRLDKDTYFKCLVNYVEPKLRMEEDRLLTLRARKAAVGSAGREAKQLEKDIDRQEQFVAELHDFRDKLRPVADLHLVPNLNDGVILNIAPLHELVPWKEAERSWEALQDAKYDWAHIAYQLWPDRVRDLCKRDLSVAIAHGLEDICEVEPPKNLRAATPDDDEAEEQEDPSDENE